MDGRLLPCGERALLVEVDDLDAVLTLRAALAPLVGGASFTVATDTASAGASGGVTAAEGSTVDLGSSAHVAVTDVAPTPALGGVAASVSSTPRTNGSAPAPATTVAPDGPATAAAGAFAAVTDVVPAATTVLLAVDRPAALPTVRAAVTALLADLDPRATRVDAAEPVEIGVHYGGEDLAEVARLTGMEPSEVVAAHTGSDWTVAFGGFAPGFAYLVDGDERLRVPRRAEPRTRVPAGAVGLAGPFSGIYPRPSPCGWQLIGRTDAVLWDADRDPPALLQPGRRVRFRALEEDESGLDKLDQREQGPNAPPVELVETKSSRHPGVERRDIRGREEIPGQARDDGETIGAGPLVELVETRPSRNPGERRDLSGREEIPGQARDDGGAVGPGARGLDKLDQPGLGLDPRGMDLDQRGLAVVATGPRALFVDEGRPGFAALGVGASGAADRGSYRLGNRLVGNAAGIPALEITLGGLVLRATATCLIALTGADCAPRVDGRPATHGGPVYLRAGQELRLGIPRAGLRTYLAVAGGFAVPLTLGSASTDTLSGVGPPPVHPGDHLAVHRPRAPRFLNVESTPRPLRPDAELLLNVLPGPRTDWLADAGALTRHEWTVSEQSDRIGVRLTGEPLARHRDKQGVELPSEPMVRGAIQVPPDGHPVIFGADHPVTGGYPVVGVLTDAAGDRLAQARPGQRVILRAQPA